MSIALHIWNSRTMAFIEQLDCHPKLPSFTFLSKRETANKINSFFRWISSSIGNELEIWKKTYDVSFSPYSFTQENKTDAIAHAFRRYKNCGMQINTEMDCFSNLRPILLSSSIWNNYDRLDTRLDVELKSKCTALQYYDNHSYCIAIPSASTSKLNLL